MSHESDEEGMQEQPCEAGHLVHRVLQPDQVVEGRATFRAFLPRNKDKGKLSLLVCATPAAALLEWQSGYPSSQAQSVGTHAEKVYQSVGLALTPDPTQELPNHHVADFNVLQDEKMRKAVAVELAKKAAVGP